MKTLSILSLSIMLAACGGGSSSSDDTSNSNNSSGSGVSTTLKNATYETALTKCGSNITLNISDHTISGNSVDYVLKPAGKAKLLIRGSSNDICISGSMDVLTIVGSSNDVFINGVVSTLKIEGSSNDVLVFDDVASIEMSGARNDVYVKTVATYEDFGSKNSIMNISDAKI